MKFVDNPKAVWKKYSTWALSALVVLPSVWMASPDLQALLPAELVTKIGGWVALAGLVGRFIDQSKK